MVEFTFLEVHLDGATLSASTGEDGGIEVESVEEAPEESESSGGRRWVAALVGLVFLAVVAFLAKRRLSEEEAVPELSD